MSSYAEALAVINRHPTTAGAAGLAKLVLSLWNDECGFSFRECIASLDDRNTALALRLVGQFAAHGEDAELVEVGHEVCRQYPRLWEQGRAATEARQELRRRWDSEDRERQAREYGDG